MTIAILKIGENTAEARRQADRALSYATLLAGGGAVVDRLDQFVNLPGVAGKVVYFIDPDTLGEMVLNKAAVGLGSVDNTADAAKAVLSATKLATARSFSITGDLAWTVSFDGSAAVTAAGTLATVNANVGTFGSATQVPQFTVNGKGLTTAAGNVTITPAWSSITSKPTTLAGYGITDSIYVVGGTDVAVTDGGTGSSTASGARTNLGLTLGTDIPDGAFAYQNASHTLTSTTSAQQIFDATANGRITLGTGLYRFEMMLIVTSMDAAGASNAKIDLLGAGGATIAGLLGHTIGVDLAAVTSVSNQNGCWVQTPTINQSVVAGVAAGQMAVKFEGVFKVTVAGTLVPSISLIVAAAAVVQAGSCIFINKIADLGTYTKGAWD